MLAFEAARERLLDAVPCPASEGAVTLDIASGAGRYLAETPRSPIDLPPFDNSAMDGWAVRSLDLTDVPRRLRIQGEVAAGGTFFGTLQPGHAVRIFTGSPLPAGADAVVMQEDARSPEPGFVQILERSRPWEHVRLRGEDLRRHADLVPCGTRLGAAHLALLAAAGMNTVRVHRHVRVAILPNGSELVPPGHPLPPGGIYESNGIALAELVASTGAIPHRLPPPRDNLREIQNALREAFASSDAVITAGGASVGEHDLIKPAFESLGGTLDFWRVAMKPGKPFFFGIIPGSPSPKFLFGVPGNPVAAFVTTLLLVLPALRKILGATECYGATHPGQLAEPLSNPQDRRHFIRIHCDRDGAVRSSGPQASHLMGSLAAANGLVDLPPNTHWPAGTSVRVWRWSD